MKVAIFFDGKNFYTSWRERATGRRLDFSRLARWLVSQTGASMLTGCHYYTGVEPDSLHDEGSRKLHRFLDQLELERGFFVYRFLRRQNLFHCERCGAENRFTQEREVDTTMTADMLRLAAVGAFDMMVLVSGDTDHVPAVEGVRALGKVAYVASWGGNGLAPRLRRAAFDHIDLMYGLSEFELPASPYDTLGAATMPVGGSLETQSEEQTAKEASVDSEQAHTHAHAPVPAPASPDASGARELIRDPAKDDQLAVQFTEELKRAQEAFHPGYVGVNYFVTRWRGSNFDISPPERRRVLDRLILENRVEIYEVNGNKALRTRPAPSA